MVSNACKKGTVPRAGGESTSNIIDSDGAEKGRARIIEAFNGPNETKIGFSEFSWISFDVIIGNPLLHRSQHQLKSSNRM